MTEADRIILAARAAGLECELALVREHLDPATKPKRTTHRAAPAQPRRRVARAKMPDADKLKAAGVTDLSIAEAARDLRKRGA